MLYEASDIGQGLWPSDMYKHFKKPVIEKHPYGIIKYVFTCKCDP